MDSDDRLALATFTIDMRYDPKDVNHAVHLLLSVRGSIQRKHGCRSCDVWTDIADAGLIHYREEWESEETFHQHVQSEEFRRILIAVDMCTEEPRIVVGNLSGQIGLEYLRQLRDEGEKMRIAGNGSSTIETNGER